MSITGGDPITQIAFSMSANKGVYALVVGSGLSRAAGIPTGWEITLDLVRRVASARGIEDQTDWAAWYRASTGAEPNYSSLLAELAISPAERRSILHSYIEPDEDDRAGGRKLPTAGHQAIARLVRDGFIRVVITTNFDRLLENALREVGIEPTVVSSVDALKGAEPITHSSCYILKLHGDYKDARILNTDEELSGYPSPYNTLLDRIFDEHGLIICGWSGEWDHALREAMLRAPNRRYPIFWALRGSPGTGAEELIEQRKAQRLPIADADTFFGTLYQQVETLTLSRRQNPMSVELTVNIVKRQLARQEDRIKLDETMSEQAAQLLARLHTAEFSIHDGWSVEGLERRVSVYENVSEGLAKAMGAMGRWGSGTEFPIARDIILAGYQGAIEQRSGLSVWIELQTYPAVILFTAYGLGLVRAERWETLHQLFTLAMPREDRDPKRLIDTLFLWEWRGEDKAIWQNLDGLKDHKTPLSDHLCDLFRGWAYSFAGVTPDFDLLFDRFEALGALAHLEKIEEAALDETLSRDTTAKERMSVGRIGWRSSGRRAIDHEFRFTATRAELLTAGFAKGSQKYMDLYLTNLGRIASWMEWH
ncbi:SIR2 family protein [Rhizobium rhizogenes]|uniref:SIR2 family protein n=1 Tax=Rhizobium rhizogenes TaxID=359 RepID=UPI00157229EC|nr:SIR2 family protein [Rhizobium rhizogenes]NTI78589.1 hypothetical protein [Rhizobium rhizogenes]